MNFNSLSSVFLVRVSALAFGTTLLACGGGDHSAPGPDSADYNGESNTTSSGGSRASGGAESTGGGSTGGATSATGGSGAGGSSNGGSSAGGSASGGASACVPDACSATADASDSFDFDCNGAEELCKDFPIAADDCSLGGQGCLGAGYLPSSRTGAGKNPYCGSTNYQHCVLDTSVGCAKIVGTTLRPAQCE